jgi:hypothetical protein
MRRRRPPATLTVLDRREAIALLGLAGSALLVGCSGAAEGPACVLAPELTAGPYWQDEGLERGDLRWDTHRLAVPDPRPGVPLQLDLRLLASSDLGCHPVRGAQVDLWHCDAMGIYSDVAESGTAGQNFLRGYQITDAAGAVSFRTIYPGWYAGRAVHIHAKVRLFDPYGERTTEVSTQLFFDDAVTDAVHSVEPYRQRGPRDTRNAMDAIYGGRRELLISLEGDPTSRYLGAIELAVRVGHINGG